MKVARQAFRHSTTAGENTGSLRRGREMNTLHGTSTSAVVTRLHDVHRGSEKSGAAGMRGCARGAGRQHTAIMTVVDTSTGTPTGKRVQGGTGERRSVSEAEFTAYVQERRASLYATAYHLTGDRFEAEDLLQSALFSTYRAWDRISDKAAVGGYLRRTMTNLHISAWRRRKLNEYPTEELPETARRHGRDARHRAARGPVAGAGPAARTPAHHAGPALLRGPHGPGDRGHPRHQCRHGEVQHLAVAPPGCARTRSSASAVTRRTPSGSSSPEGPGTQGNRQDVGDVRAVNGDRGIRGNTGEHGGTRRGSTTGVRKQRDCAGPGARHAVPLFRAVTACSSARGARRPPPRPGGSAPPRGRRGTRPGPSDGR